MICPVPELGVELPEQSPGGRFPSPPKIETHLSKWLQVRRQDRRHIVGLKSRHAFKPTAVGGVYPGAKHWRFQKSPFDYPANRAAVNQENVIRQVVVWCCQAGWEFGEGASDY